MLIVLVASRPFLKELLLHLEETFRAAHANICGYRSDRSIGMTSKLQVNKSSQGDLGYELDSASVVGQSRKPQSIYVGLFLVTEVISPVVYWVEDQKRSMALHHDHLALCDNCCIPFWVVGSDTSCLNWMRSWPMKRMSAYSLMSPMDDGQLPVPGSSGEGGGVGWPGVDPLHFLARSHRQTCAFSVATEIHGISWNLPFLSRNYGNSELNGNKMETVNKTEKML